MVPVNKPLHLANCQPVFSLFNWDLIRLNLMCAAYNGLEASNITKCWTREEFKLRLPEMGTHHFSTSTSAAEFFGPFAHNISTHGFA